MKKSLSIGIAASALYLAGCGIECPQGQLLDEASGTCVDNNNTNCGAGTIDDGNGNCVVDTNCNSNPGLCDANETCNATTGQCEPTLTTFSCNLVGGGSVDATEANLTIPGTVQLSATLSDSQVSNAGDGADFVFHINLPEKSDLLVRTLPGLTSPDTVLVLRQGNCNTGTDIVVADDLNIDNGQSAVLSARSLDAGDYFLFVDSKTSAPITEPVQLQVLRTQIVANGSACIVGSNVQRCDNGLACLSPAFSGNVEAVNTCETFTVAGTRLFALTDSGIAELDPGNGTVINEAQLPFQLSGTSHYALAYDDINDKLFLHDSFSTQIDDPDGDGIGPDIKSEVLIFDANTFDRVGEWGVPAGGGVNPDIQIEGLAFNRTASVNQQIAAFDALSNAVSVLDATAGVFSFDYGLNNNNATLVAGLGIDAFSAAQNGSRGYVTKSDTNQVQEFVLGQGGFLRTVSAPPLTGIQCGYGAKGDFGFVGYDTGLVRVITAVDNVVPNLPAGSFVTEYLAPGLHACGMDAGDNIP